MLSVADVFTNWAQRVYYGYSVGIYVGALIFGAALIIVIALTLTKYLKWRVAKNKAGRRARKQKYRSDGVAYPPSGRGMCDACKKPHEKVYHLPTGRRLCHDCYESLEMNAAAKDDRATYRRQPVHDNRN